MGYRNTGIQETKYRITTGHRTQDTVHRIQNIEYRIQNTEHRKPNGDTDYRLRDTELRGYRISLDVVLDRRKI